MQVHNILSVIYHFIINKCVPIYISVVRLFKYNVIFNNVSKKKETIVNILSVVFFVIDISVYSITIQFTFYYANVIVFVIADK